MAQAMISHQQSMEMDLILNVIGLEMVEILKNFKKVDQADQNFFQDNNGNQKRR